MYHLKLVWWVFWRGLLYGGIEGILFGTLVSPFDGTIYGVLIGTIMGVVLGLLNGISLAVMTYTAFRTPIDRSRYIRDALIIVIPIDLLIVLLCIALTGVLGIITALITVTIVYCLYFGFPEYGMAQLAHITSTQ